jgi:beta-glucosidase
MRHLMLFTRFTLLLWCFLNTAPIIFAQKTTVANIEARVEALLKKMTLDEKIGQLNQVPGDITTGTDVKQDNLLNSIRAGKVSSILSNTNFATKRQIQEVAVKETRLGIPIIFGFDVIHGYKTIFPIPVAQAASWDLAAIEQGERIAATEAAADGQQWAFAPMVDIARDPRWGRVMEGAGEDPYLGSLIAAARVKGFQANDLAAPNTIAACAKHFAGYGFSEAGRDYNIVDMSEQRLRDVVLPPFEAAAKAGSATFMNSFNTINGTPASMHKHLITDILRGEWGWRGMIVSDWNSFGETIIHGAADDEVDASAKCLTAGSDMDMVGGTFLKGLKTALEKGRVTQAQIDEAVRRVLRLKFAVGLFDDPYRYFDDTRRKETLEKPEYRQVARSMAAKSMVLLKNQGNLLPLKKGGPYKKIALIGPLADSRTDKAYMSFWTLALGFKDYDSTKVVSAAQGLVPALEAMGYQVIIASACATGDCGTDQALAAAKEAARQADLVIACVGERGLDCGESRSVANIDLPRNQEQLLKAIGETGKPTVMVLFNSRPLIFSWASKNIPAILCAWQPGFEAGNALADVLTGAVNPSGKLPITFPLNLGQVPIYYNNFNTGRPQPAPGTMWTTGYLDSPNDPAYPFGFGLSYTTFEYADLRLSKSAYGMTETVEATITVKNTGNVAGEEVVQCYIRDLSADVVRPLKELKGFEKISLAPGTSKQVTFRLTAKDLSYWNDKLVFKADPGKFKLMVGRSSADVLTADFELKK